MAGNVEQDLASGTVTESTKQAPAAQTAFPHADAAKKAEEIAMKAHAEVNAKALPIRQCLEHTVVPLLMQGTQLTGAC